MKIFELKDNEDRVFAFEVSNTFLTRKKVCKIAGNIPGATIIREPKAFRLSHEDEEEFCEFQIDGVHFEASEPFGDSSRFWIGPKDGGWTPQIKKVKEAFQKTGNKKG